MKRVVTATCLAAAFAVGLAAQSATSSTQTPSASPNQRGATGPRTVTGCLRAGDKEGTFMLTDVVMPAGARSGDTTGTTGGTTAGGETTAGGTGTTPRPPTSIMLMPASDVDLKAHVGHKIEVTGTMAGGGARRTGTPGGSSGAGTTTGEPTTSAAGGSTAGGTTAGSSAYGTGGQGGGRGARSMNITAVRMISESCS
jgi:hypothetical protein